jgi:hypothetical protein
MNDGPGYELIVVDGTRRRTERFGSVAALLSREHELLSAWRALGWQDVTTRTPGGRQLQ